MTSRQVCNSTNTVDGQPCRNPKESCPFPSHRRASLADAETSRSAARDAFRDAQEAPLHWGPAMVYPPARSGFAATGARFARAVSETADAIGLPEESVAHDYWIVRALRGMRDVVPADGEIVFPPVKRHQPERRIGTWAFGGGTSLTAAWGIVERYSEDIDGLLFLDSSDLSKHIIEKACGQVARAACDACESVNHETRGPMVKSTKIDLEGHPAYLKVDTAVQHGAAAAVESRTVRSLIARCSNESLEDEFPELGGFTMPCVRPAYTAVNKLDALHRRAARSDLEGLVARGRDLYDLWAITQHQEHADEVRSSVESLWELTSGQIRESVERPAGGYAQSPAFHIENEAREALRSGYERAVDTTVWGNTPSFEDAVEAAKSLDNA